MPAYSTTTFCNSSAISIALSLSQFAGSTKCVYKSNSRLIDPYYGGRYKITGVAKRAGVETQRKIALFSRNNRLILKETLSDINGNYEFNCIKYIVNGYYVIEFDDSTLSQPYNAAIADFVTPVPM